MSFSPDTELPLSLSAGAGQVAPVPGPGFDFASQWKLATYYFRVGFLGESFEAFQRAAALATRPEGVAKSYLGMAHCLRCSNNPDSALEILQLTRKLAAVSSTVQMQITWERIFAECQRDFSVTPIMQALLAVRQGIHSISHHESVYATLWCYAIPRGRVSTGLPTSQSLGRTFVRMESDREWQEQLSLVRCLEACYSKEIPLQDRLNTLGASLQRIRVTDDTELHALFLAAAVRWLLEVKAFEVAVTALYDYREMSSRMSQGRNNGLFDLLKDLNALDSIG